MRSDSGYFVAVMSTRYPAATLALAVVAAALSGCAPAPEPSPTPTPAFASEEEAFAAAEEVYREYIEAFNRVDLQDPASFEELSDYTAGDYRAGEREDLSRMHAEEQVRSGAIGIVWIRSTKVDDDGRIYIRTCNDVSGTSLVDRDGVSLVSPERPPTFAIELEFELVDHSLRLIASKTVEDSSCVLP